jgi:hypothetical protein
MMPQGLPCLCQPAITGMAGGGAQVCGGDAAHTRTRACCRASLLVVKGDREVRDTTSVPTPQGRQLEHKGADTARLAARCRFTANWRLNNAPSPNPAAHAHRGGGVHVGNMQATCKHTCMHTCSKACKAHAHAQHSPCTKPAVGQTTRSIELSARVLQHGCWFCFVFMLSDAFPQVHGFFLFFFLCFFFWCCVLKFALTACLRSTAVNVLFGHVPRSAIRFGATLSQLPSCRAVWGGFSASHLYRRPCTGPLFCNCLLGAPPHAPCLCVYVGGGGGSPSPPSTSTGQQHS